MNVYERTYSLESMCCGVSAELFHQYYLVSHELVYSS